MEFIIFIVINMGKPFDAIGTLFWPPHKFSDNRPFSKFLYIDA